jgi:hypothetical protein
MRLRLRWFSRPEDRFEAWIAQRHQESVLEGGTRPPGPCPDEAFLKSLARKSKQIALSAPQSAASPTPFATGEQAVKTPLLPQHP